MSQGPIQSDYHQKMNELAHFLDDCFKPYGFSLLAFPLDDTDGRMNYISNARREDMLIAMKEFIANNEGRVPEFTNTKQ